MEHIIEQGDVEAALNAASAVGDDRLQRQARGTVVPDAFMHGSSVQRVRCFERGLRDCQTTLEHSARVLNWAPFWFWSA